MRSAAIARNGRVRGYRPDLPAGCFVMVSSPSGIPPFAQMRAPQECVLAHMWNNLAAAQGNKDAQAYRDLSAQHMTSAQIAEAQKLAREWKPTAQAMKP